MNAFAYLRKSVVRLDDPKNSAEAEESAVRALAARHGDADSLVLLSDWDTSGRLAASRRPGYDALIRAIESGTCTALYSYSMARLARSLSELTRLLESCHARNIPVRLVADAVDTSTASGRVTATVLASVLAFEADVASERMKATRRAKSAANERMGPRLYGDGPRDDPAAVLAAFREAGSSGAAARLLNERGVPVRSGSLGVWWPRSVEMVVRRLDPFVLPSTVKKGVRAGPAHFTFSRLLVCPTCGMRLSGQQAKRTGRVQYVCSHARLRPHPRSGIAEHLILPAIKAEALDLHSQGRAPVRKIATPAVMLGLALVFMGAEVAAVAAADGARPDTITQGQMTLQLTSTMPGATLNGDTLVCPPMLITVSSGNNPAGCEFTISSTGTVPPSSVTVTMAVSGMGPA